MKPLAASHQRSALVSRGGHAFSRPARARTVAARAAGCSPQPGTAIVEQAGSAEPLSSTDASLPFESYPLPPTLPGSLPLLGDLLKLDLRRKYASHHQLLNAAGSRVLMVRYLGKSVVLVREPGDVAAALQRQAEGLRKHPRLKRVHAWMGEGLGTQLDVSRHAAQRELLNPAFRPDYLRGLVGAFARNTQEGLPEAVRRAQASTPPAPSPPAPAPPGCPPAVDVQELLRRHSMDVAGAATLGLRLGCLERAGRGGGEEHGAGSVGSNPSASDPGPGPGSGPDWASVDLAHVVEVLEAGALPLLLQIPFVPDTWLPGYGPYMAAARQLDELVYGLIRERRSRGVRDEDPDLLAHLLRAQAQGAGGVQEAGAAGEEERLSRGEAAAAGTEGASGCPYAAATSALAAVAAAVAPGAGGGPAPSVSDKQIRDELATMLSASDSAAYVLSFAAHRLAGSAPDQRAARAEVLEVLAGRPPSQLTAEDLRRLPFLTACVQETMRLVPSFPEITRRAARDEVVGGHRVPSGSTLVVSLYSMHRHPAVWPRPDEWLPQRWVAEEARPGYAHWGPGQGAEALGARQPNAFLPFGLTLAALLWAFDLLPPGGEGAPLAPLATRQGVSVRARDGVWLSLRPREEAVAVA
ncbi:hypothetical protein HYH03_012372 [Edaphochlamys debaryana]|uniref:Cytochrome P450 n=1 Tax=Edaphochlamys debaryana TaxID=47281 RepID=A0A836BU37_9CHLO|nr:hypothetical protein HYH03_012372 [Edaphochlamys debaryana]|eukprot:KAG2489146.1 hypothetical protein HYH03_012372 [Edaphochlamys debaryana]